MLVVNERDCSKFKWPLVIVICLNESVLNRETVGRLTAKRAVESRDKNE